MFNRLKKLFERVHDINSTVDKYKKESDNQTLPSLALVNRAKKLIEQKKYLDAKKVLEQALLLTDKDSLVYKNLGICEEYFFNFAKAEEHYQKSANLNPQDKTIWHKLGMTQINQRKYEQAEKSFEAGNKVCPLNTDIQTGWGMSLFKQKKYTEAHEKFMMALKINHYNFSALILAAITEIRLEKYDDAEQKLKFLISANPTEACMYEYANLLFQQEKYNDALVYAGKALAINPNMLPAYLILGNIYSRNFDYENAQNAFEEAQKRELIGPQLYKEWGDALNRLNRFGEALEKFKKSEDVTSGLALSYAELGEFSKAEEVLSKVEEDINTTQTKGLLEFANENYQKAIEHFKSAISENYNYFRLAKCYEKLSNDDMVKDSYEKFIKFCPDYAQGYIEFAKYLISINDYKDAQRKLRKAEKLEPMNQELLNQLFYVSYVLVKDNFSEYNVKEAISLANRIKDFKYPELKVELEEQLNK